MTHDACLTVGDYKNRTHAIIVGRVTAVLCISILAYGYWTAWSHDRMHQEEMLKMGELQLAEQAILENIQFGRVIVDSNGTIVSANAAFKKWTHWPNCVGKKLYDIMPEPIRTLHTAGFNAAVSRAKSSETPLKPKLIDCKLPRIDDPTKVTHVTIAVSIVRPHNPEESPYVVAYLYKTKSLQRVTVR